MKITDLMRMGLRNLGRRKARTALTVVGIVIGTISIVVMVSIGIGMNQTFTSSIMELGSMTLITVNREGGTFDANGNYESKTQQLDDELVEKLRAIPNVKMATAVINGNVLLRSGSYEMSMNIRVMDADSFEAFDFPALKDGATYEKSTNKNKIKIWMGKEMLGWFYNPNSANYQSKEIDPKKDRVTIELAQDQNTPYDDQGNMLVDFKKYSTEICIFDAGEYSEYNWSMYVDRDQYQKMYEAYLRQLPVDNKKKAEKTLKEYESIQVNANNVKDVQGIQDAIREMGYSSSSLSDFTNQMQQTANMLELVLGGVGAVAMLVAAISIANTMIMSIYERTKEIGVMKVLGCQVADIKKLFLFEAAMMGLIGGVIGITMSYAASFAINNLSGSIGSALGGLLGGGETKLSVIPIWLPFAASLFAMMVGVASGYYPASRATKISAIEAMKSE